MEEMPLVCEVRTLITHWTFDSMNVSTIVSLSDMRQSLEYPMHTSIIIYFYRQLTDFTTL